MNTERWLKRMQSSDARIKIMLSIVLGVCAWRAGPWALGLFFLTTGLLAWTVAEISLFSRRQMKGLLLFVGVWTAVKAGMEIVAHNPVWLKESLILGVRLSVLVLVGLSLAALTSRVQVGRAVSSLFRPVFRDRSWQGAMSLALMIHFIPVTMGTMHSVQRTLSLRGHGLSVRQRLHLFVTTVMRNLSRSTWDQTMALAVRGLEEQKAWQQHQAFRVKEWIAGGVLGVSIWILSGF